MGLCELSLRLGKNLRVPPPPPTPDGVLSCVGWHGALLKLGCQTLPTAWESAAIEYLVLGVL